MTKIQKSEIQTFQKRLQLAMETAQKQRRDLITVEADAAKYERELVELGDPDYRDDKAISRIVLLKQKRDLCVNTLQRLRDSEEQTLLALRELVSTGGGGALAARILQEMANARIETVTLLLLPFSFSRTDAQKAAKETDACQDAQNIVYSYARSGATLQGRWMFSDKADACIAAAQQLIAVYAEALAAAPDLGRFLPFAPAQEAAQEGHHG